LASGKRRTSDKTAMTALPAGTPVALESGTVAFFVARQLTALGLAPLVVDAHEVRLKARRPTQKSDRRDAFELCAFRSCCNPVGFVGTAPCATTVPSPSWITNTLSLQCTSSPT